MMPHDYTRGPLTRGPRGNFTRHSGPVHTLVIHYLWTLPTQDVRMKQVNRWHVNRPAPFNGVGYHHLIRINGEREFGRPEWARGAGVAGHNDRVLHVAYAGGQLPGDSVNGHNTLHPSQEHSMKALIFDLLKRHPTITEVVGHRDLAPSQCPGFDVVPWWGKARIQGPKPPAADAKNLAARNAANPFAALIKAISRIVRTQA